MMYKNIMLCPVFNKIIPGAITLYFQEVVG